MAVRHDIFLRRKVEEFYLGQEIRTLELYDFVNNKEVKYLLSILHQELNRLFTFMYSKYKTNGHYNADQSRDLLRYIGLYKDMKYMLKGTEYDFTINENYEKFIAQTELFLQDSGGSSIPNNLMIISILEYEPIFELENTIKVKNIKNHQNYSCKLIGEGSYAKVFKYKDEFYDKNFVIKRAKSDLSDKELIRFKKEFTVMKELKSPYVLDVYKYDEDDNQYYAEYADETIYDYISKNNNTITMHERKNLIYQILKAFSYIHKKGYLHRDISLTNILLISFDDVKVVKVSDFGLVKTENSHLTSTNSDVKGSLNDSNLSVIGFENYSIEYETFALTRLIMFVLTGKVNLDKIKDNKIRNFVLKGLDRNIDNRYKSVAELREYFDKIFK